MATMVQSSECGHSFQNNSALLTSILFMIVTLAIVSTFFFPSFFFIQRPHSAVLRACSWYTPGLLILGLLKEHSWWLMGSDEHMEFWGSNSGQQCAKQKPYLLYYILNPSFHFFLPQIIHNNVLYPYYYLLEFPLL